MTEELKPTGSIGDYAKFHQLLNAAYEACGALDQATGKEAFPASDKLTEVQNRLIEYIDDWTVRRASRPEAESEMPAKPYAYEYGKSNGDGTYSVVIDRGDMVQVAERKYEYGPPKRAVKDWPVKPLYTRPVAGNAARDDARDAPSDDALQRVWNLGLRADFRAYEALRAELKASKQGGE